MLFQTVYQIERTELLESLTDSTMVRLHMRIKKECHDESIKTNHENDWLLYCERFDVFNFCYSKPCCCFYLRYRLSSVHLQIVVLQRLQQPLVGSAFDLFLCRYQR